MRQIIRSLFPQKRLSASIVAIRTVGVGANATVFASVRPRDLPFRTSNDLMIISEGGSGFGQDMRPATPSRETRSGMHDTVAARKFF
jgi:hypothetical protein